MLVISGFWFWVDGILCTCDWLFFFPLEESERAKEGDGFDQVGTNPCNSK